MGGWEYGVLTRHLVLGLGAVGSALLAVLRETYGSAAAGYDVLQADPLQFSTDRMDCHVLHVCIPYFEGFRQSVTIAQGFQHRDCLIILHSTVPIGTTAKIPNAVHSPILGRHPHLARDMRTFLKWIGGPRSEEAANILGPAGFRVRCVPTSEETEALKLLDLVKFGADVAFAHYVREVCEKVGFSLSDWLEYCLDYNLHVETRLKRPLIAPMQDTIGGHCVIPATQMLAEQFPHEILDGVLKYG